jgi:hypothetical protein
LDPETQIEGRQGEDMREWSPASQERPRKFPDYTTSERANSANTSTSEFCLNTVDGNFLSLEPPSSCVQPVGPGMMGRGTFNGAPSSCLHLPKCAVCLLGWVILQGDPWWYRMNSLNEYNCGLPCCANPSKNNS